MSRISRKGPMKGWGLYKTPPHIRPEKGKDGQWEPSKGRVCVFAEDKRDQAEALAARRWPNSYQAEGGEA